jgi:hypothetical protein
MYVALGEEVTDGLAQSLLSLTGLTKLDFSGVGTLAASLLRNALTSYKLLTS